MRPIVPVLLLVLATATGCSSEPELPVLSTVPEFKLTERSAREVNSRELAGKVWVADFIFTSCAGACPSMTEKMRSLQETLPEEIQLVSFTVDPARDTPEVLTQYAESYGADPARWLFLTGEKEVLYRLSIEGFKLAVDDTMGTEIEPITHSSRFVLIDQEGGIRGYYAMGDTTELDRLARDARSLL